MEKTETTTVITEPATRATYTLEQFEAACKELFVQPRGFEAVEMRTQDVAYFCWIDENAAVGLAPSEAHPIKWSAYAHSNRDIFAPPDVYTAVFDDPTEAIKRLAELINEAKRAGTYPRRPFAGPKPVAYTGEQFRADCAQYFPEADKFDIEEDQKRASRWPYSQFVAFAGDKPVVTIETDEYDPFLWNVFVAGIVLPYIWTVRFPSKALEIAAARIKEMKAAAN